MRWLYMLLCLLGGGFCVFCAAKDYDFFMNSNKAWLFVKIFGRNGARIFYIILGLVIICFGVWAGFFANIGS